MHLLSTDTKQTFHHQFNDEYTSTCKLKQLCRLTLVKKMITRKITNYIFFIEKNRLDFKVMQ